ncbi:thiamine pyrophosphate-dependent dehydrogenase E1 component subunit alpha [Sinosporangium siamense]|uniref:2-oxoisovalerate dehydrogenase subunit alpha n=1 Tax=Sinosporangium siamense TaxID=1367973 RepID=A0A919RMW9_9ACTN|nr:thiamine pyrophosphate-dependent dehydrogenase E1 component subunit alpha [Sinosporangium siamense]GII95384.1 pyruvate dehydrogenase E1 subunit alpha [Sinosporangium siamense]
MPDMPGEELPLQLLDPSGALRADDRLPLDLSTVDLPGLYRDMVLSRRIDTEAIALQRQGELGLWPSMSGQEGAQVGAGRALREQDMTFPSYREHAVAWCRGVEPTSLLGLFRGTTLGGWRAEDNNFNLYTLVIGAQTLHATGYAMGIVRDNLVGNGDNARDTAVLCFHGDGALSEGETNEAYVWAATQNLPIVFFCQNNQWAISAPYSTQSRVPAARRADGFGFPGVRVDGNDVLACLAATRQALDAARRGDGPTLIEAYTYRLNPHTTSDDAGRYRSPAEDEVWRERDPITRLRLHLESTGAVSETFFTDLDDDAQRLAERMRAGCRALPDPDPDSPFLHTYAEMPDTLRAQLAEHRDFIASLDAQEVPA